MLFLKIVLFLAAAVAAGYAFARWLPIWTIRGAADSNEGLRALKLERDRLRLELDEARREPPASDAVDARVEHLRSAVHAAKRRIAELEDDLQEAQRMIAVVSSGPSAGRPAGVAPERLEEPRGAVDDLKRITGIGPSIERKLNELGIFHFWQIAGLDDGNVLWLEAQLPIRGRAHRQDWIGQAKVLAGSGADTAAPIELAPAH